MSLKNQVAVTFAADGPIGAAAARAFAQAGATTILAGLHRGRLERLAEEIGSAGGQVAFAIVDTLDEAAVEGFAATVVAEEGRIDLAFDATAYGDVDEPLTALSPEDFARPFEVAQRSQKLTTRVVARQMIRQGSGTILSLGRQIQNAAEEPATRVAADAIAGLRRQWACEGGTLGVLATTPAKRTPSRSVRRDDSQKRGRSAQVAVKKPTRRTSIFDTTSLACGLLVAVVSPGSRRLAAT